MSEKNIYAVNIENNTLNFGPVSVISKRFKENNIANLIEKVEYETHYAAENKRIASIYVTDINKAFKIEKEIKETNLYSEVNIVCKGKIKDNYPNICQIMDEPENHHVSIEDFLA